MKIKFFITAMLISSQVFTQVDMQSKIAGLLENYQYDSTLMIIEQFENEDTADFRKHKAIALKGLNRYQQALSIYLELYNADTLNLSVIVEIANCYKQLGNIQEAIIFLQRGQIIYNNNSYIKLQIANNYYSLQDYDKAIVYYNRLFVNDTSNHYLARQLAFCYDKINLIDSAIIYFQKAIWLNESDYQSVFRLANLYIKKEKLDEAKIITDKYMGIDTLNSSINRINAYIWYLLKDFNKAASKFEYCYSLNDTTVFVYRFLGLSYFKSEQYSEAKPFVEKTYLSDTSNTEFLYYYAQSCIKAEYIEEGIFYLNKLIDKINPSPESLSEIYQQLANAYTMLRKPEEGLKALIKANEIAPTDKLILFKIARQYDVELDNSKDKALSYYEDFLATRPPQSDSIKPVNSGININFFDYTEERIFQLKEELFWEKE
jgi:tetratricopeptide (TPR) repeat protein